MFPNIGYIAFLQVPTERINYEGEQVSWTPI